MRAHVNCGAPPGHPSAALRDRWKFCGCAGDDNDGNWLASCALAPPMISSTSLAETLPLPHFSLRVSIKGFFAPDPAPLSATRRRMPPLRCELELLWPSTTSRTACASAILLRTPPLGDMMKMQVRTEQTRVAKCKSTELQKNTKDERNKKVTARVKVPYTNVTLSMCEQVARKVACESSADKYGAVRKCLLELSCCSVKRPIESVFRQNGATSRKFHCAKTLMC